MSALSQPLRHVLVTSCTAMALTVGGAVVVAPAASAADEAPFGTNGLIAFDQFRFQDPGAQVWVVDPLTTVETDLSKTHFGDDEPSFSPNGKQIAFRHGGAIWTMSTTGTHRTNLTPDRHTLSQPDWSPNGKQIAYVDNGEIGVMNADGSGQHVVTTGGSSTEPAWSPDGKLIAFTSRSVDGVAQIFTMKPNGTKERDLSSHTSSLDQSPEWSPDSQLLLFNSNRAPEGFENFLMTARGKNVTQITQMYPSGSGPPAYSPDGKSLAFVANQDGAGQIFAQPLTGGFGSEAQVTFDPENSIGGNLSWQRVAP